MERIFNTVFISFGVSIFGARLLYALVNPSADFFNPLVFFLFPYFPGLSLAGGMAGALITFFVLMRKEKNICYRLFDFFSMAFLVSFPFGVVGYFLLSSGSLLDYYAFGVIIVSIMLAVSFVRFVLPLLLSGKLKEGSAGLIFLSSFSLIVFVINLLGRLDGKIYFTLEEGFLVIFFVMSIIFIIFNEQLLIRIKKISKIGS